MKIKSQNLATVIYNRAERALNQRIISDAAATISLYAGFYEKQDLGNGNNLHLPYIKAFNDSQDCDTVPGTQQKIINDSGLSKITEIKDALEPIIACLKTRKIITIGVISLIIAIATSTYQYLSYNRYYKEYEDKYNEEVEKISKAEAILNAAENISEADSNSAYHVAGCINTYNSAAKNLGLSTVDDFYYDAEHRNLLTGKVVEKAITSFQSLKINLYAYIAKEKRIIQPITTYQVLKQTIWDHIITTLFQIIGYLGSFCSIFDYFGINPFKRKR